MARIKVQLLLLQMRRISNSLIDISPQVKNALQNAEPIVALESTIITHGMPYPENLETALSVEEIVTKQGATPATVAILDGRVKVGLDKDSLMKLSTEKKCVKVSRRDFPYVISKGMCGGTTVAGTLIIAKLVGISVFVTGGIGGVHRAVQDTMDISADLYEMSRSPVMVVSSGVKSILDIGKTLEYLETLGIPSVVYGDSKEFPAFYSRISGYQAAYNVRTPSEAADMLVIIREIGLDSGVLMAVPVPEEFALDGNEMNNVIDKALKQAEDEKIKGKSVTPFLLQKISSLTEGRSLQSNIALIKNNAIVGSQIAVELSKKLRKKASVLGFVPSNAFCTSAGVNRSKSRPVVIGASIMDCVVQATEPIQTDGRTLHGKVQYKPGGVARNIADALGKLLPRDCGPIFISAIGEDEMGKFLLNSLPRNVDKEGILVTDRKPTASACVLLDEKGHCLFIVGSMDIHEAITPSLVQKHLLKLEHSPLIVIDGNLPQETINFVLDYAKNRRVPVWFEPADFRKARKPFVNRMSVDYISPNFQELQAIANVLRGVPVKNISIEKDDPDAILKETKSLISQVLLFVPNIMATLGKHGVAMAAKSDGPERVALNLYKPRFATVITNVSGAGDCMAAGYIAGILSNFSPEESVRVGLSCALKSLACDSPVPDVLELCALSEDAVYVESLIITDT